jgi:antitoxin FitA
MASITIRNLADDVKRRLRIRAAENGRSMEEEAREILEKGVAPPSGLAEEPKPFRTGADLWDAIRALVEPLGGIELEIPPRHPMRDPPDFSGPQYGTYDDE